MKNVHLLPTDKPSRLRIGDNGNFVFGMIQTSIQSKNDDFTNQHIYITSDEKIKEEDWVINLKSNKVYSIFILNEVVDYEKKIILTTDPDLIKYGVQAIDDNFLEWFVKNPSCEEVEVKLENYYASGALQPNLWQHKIIIPKEEPTISDEAKQRAKNYMSLKGALEPKQETLEEAAEKFANDCTLVSDAAAYEGFIEGAKWQAERMYSEEGVLKILRQFNKDKPKLIFGVEEWFEQFKKK